MLPFSFRENEDKILEEVNKRIKIANISDPDGFTLIQGIIIPGTTQLLEEYTPFGKLFPQVAVVGKRSGMVHYFYLDKLFPGQGLD
jgi:hypothetical protein